MSTEQKTQVPVELVEALIKAAREHVIAYRSAIVGIAKQEAAGPRVSMPHDAHKIQEAQTAYNAALARYQHKVEELQLNEVSS